MNRIALNSGFSNYFPKIYFNFSKIGVSIDIGQS